MLERWRKPAEVLEVEEIADQGIWLPDGRVQGGLRVTLSPETVERMRLGYMCAKCWEPFEHAWPERCHFCGAPIRTAQAEYFAREFGGEVPTSSAHTFIDGHIHERAKEYEHGN